MRRLPVYILIQTSGAMRGEPIESIKVCLDTMVSALRQDPYALETAYLSLISFNRKPELLVSLTSVEELQIPQISQPNAAGTHLGEALEFLCLQVKKEVMRNTTEQKGDWKPLLYVMCDGRVSDLQRFHQAIPTISSIGFGIKLVTLVGAHSVQENVKEFADNIVHIATTDTATFKAYFKWVSNSVSTGQRSAGIASTIVLPPPPEEVNKII